MEFTQDDTMDDQDEKPRGINKFKKIGTTIKLVSSLSTKIVPDMGDRPSMDSVSVSKSCKVLGFSEIFYSLVASGRHQFEIGLRHPWSTLYWKCTST